MMVELSARVGWGVQQGVSERSRGWGARTRRAEGAGWTAEILGPGLLALQEQPAPVEHCLAGGCKPCSPLLNPAVGESSPADAQRAGVAVATTDCSAGVGTVATPSRPSSLIREM